MPIMEEPSVTVNGDKEIPQDQSSGDLSSLTNDPILGPILAQNPDLISQMMGTGEGGSFGSGALSLPDLLVGTAMEVSGRYGTTGNRFNSTLPPWARNLAPEALGNPDFDPYLGIVSQQGDERVYMGGERSYTTGTKAVPGAYGEHGDDFRSGGNTTQTVPVEEQGDKTQTVTQVLNAPYTWDDEEIKDAMKRMRQAGIPVTSFDSGDASLMNVWQNLVTRAGMTYSLSQGKKKVTPWDVLDMYKSEAQTNGTYTNYQNGTATTTTKSVASVTEGEAWTSLQSTLSQMLGRDPSDQEIRDFAYRMNQLAAQNPSITKTITRYKNGEAVGQTNKTEGGFSAGDVAEAAYNKAQNDPDYGAYQSATTYYNAALTALGAIGNVSN